MGSIGVGGFDEEVFDGGLFDAGSGIAQAASGEREPAIFPGQNVNLSIGVGVEPHDGVSGAICENHEGADQSQ